MGLDAETPQPPELATGHTPDDYDEGGGMEFRRDELEAALAEGAWADGFAEWSDHTDLDREDWQVVLDLGLLAEYDFFWDDVADRVGYSAPGLPEDWKERDLHPNLDSWAVASGINAGLAELGRTVASVLEDQYVDWDSEFEAPDDLPEY